MIKVLFYAGALLLVDQWSKRLVSAQATDRPLVWRQIRIRLVANSRAIYTRRSVRAVLVLIWGAALLAAITLHRSGSWFQSNAAQLGLACAFGGAAGNLLDILRRGHVVDFIDLGWWPVFNLADVAIVGGLAVAFWPAA